MKIYSAYVSSHLVKANVVESFEARPRYLAHSMIRNEKGLLPPHEEVFPLCAVFVMKVGLLRLFGQRPPRGKPAPVVHVCFVRRSPRLMSGLKGIFWTDDFAFEIGGQCRVLRSKTCNNPISKYFNAFQPDCLNLPSMRRYPHSSDSAILTLLISTSTLYFCLSDC